MGWSEEEFVRRYKEGVAKGIVIASAKPNQLAKDVRFLDFNVGIFSYFLTQYLWQNPGTFKDAIAYASQQIPRKLKQDPMYEVKMNSGSENQPMYFVENPSPVASAVVMKTEDNQARIWLGGLTLQQKAQLKPGTQLNVVNSQSDLSGKAVFQSRQGLTARVQMEGPLEPGTLLSL